MKKQQKPPPVNLLDLTAERSLPWEEGEEGRAVLLVPKFTNPLAVRYLAPFLKSPHIRVKLDDFGSHVWMQCSGDRTVGEIAESLRETFGEKAEPAYERVGVFIRRLAREKFVTLTSPAGEKS